MALTSKTTLTFQTYLLTLDPRKASVLNTLAGEALHSMSELSKVVGVEATVKVFRYLADIAEEAFAYAKGQAGNIAADKGAVTLTEAFDQLDAQCDARSAGFMPLPGVYGALQAQLEAGLNQAQREYLDSVTNETRTSVEKLRDAVGPEQADVAVMLGAKIQMGIVQASMLGLSRENVIKLFETILEQQRNHAGHETMLKALETAAPMPKAAA